MIVLKEGKVTSKMVGKCLNCQSILQEERFKLAVSNDEFAWEPCIICGFNVNFVPERSEHGKSIMGLVNADSQ